MKRWMLVFGALLLVMTAVWKFGFSQRWSDRYSDGWTWEVNTLGQTGYPDEATGQYPEGTTLADDPINLTARTVTADASAAPAGQVLISDHYETRDPVTDEVTWDYTSTATVDAATGQNVGGDGAGDYYFFPRNVAKNTTYVISNSSYVSLPVVFDHEENIGGVNTYLFTFHGDLDNTAANADWVTLEPGQVVTCFDFVLEYWVEPVTGEIVKYQEACEGDWVVSTSGERLSTVSRWGGEVSGDDLIRQVTRVQNIKMSYLWASLYGPLAAAALGIVLVVIGFVPQAAASPKPITEAA